MIVFAWIVALLALLVMAACSAVAIALLGSISLNLRETFDAIKADRQRRAALEAAAAEEATAYLTTQKTAVEANIRLIDLAAQRLEAERAHIETCEERYRASLDEAESLMSVKRKETKH